MQLDYKSGFESLTGAVLAGVARDIVTQHPANPVPTTNLWLDAAELVAGGGLELLGAATRSPAIEKIGRGMLFPAYAYAAADTTQFIRNKMATTAAATPTQLVLRGGGPAFNPAPQQTYATDVLGDF